MPCPAVQRLRQRPQAFLAAHRSPFDMLRAGLGSTAITADSNESRVARLRHKAWSDSHCTLEPIRKTGVPLCLWLDRLAFRHVIRIGSYSNTIMSPGCGRTTSRRPADGAIPVFLLPSGAENGERILIFDWSRIAHDRAIH
jgi:hypothetical protein